MRNHLKVPNSLPNSCYGGVRDFWAPAVWAPDVWAPKRPASYWRQAKIDIETDGPFQVGFYMPEPPYNFLIKVTFSQWGLAT